jgi:hypothetical protein
VGDSPRRFDIDELDDENPFEIDRQLAHLSKHGGMDVDVTKEVWESDCLFYPAKPPAHWLMIAEVGGAVIVVPLAPPDSGDPQKCRPIGCYEADQQTEADYRADRRSAGER